MLRAGSHTRMPPPGFPRVMHQNLPQAVQQDLQQSLQLHGMKGQNQPQQPNAQQHQALPMSNGAQPSQVLPTAQADGLPAHLQACMHCCLLCSASPCLGGVHTDTTCASTNSLAVLTLSVDDAR